MSGVDAPGPITIILSDISWGDRLVSKKYRNGGQGLEIVLTTEALQALQYLPRHPFLHTVLSTLKSDNGYPFTFSKTEIQESGFG